MEVSPLKVEDSQKLEDFLALVFGEELRPLARGDIAHSLRDNYSRHGFLVCKQGDEIIAAAAISQEIFTVDNWGISWGSVHPDYRHRKLIELVGHACIEEITKKIDTTSSVIVSVAANQVNAYRKAGFSGTTKDHSGRQILTRTIYPADMGGVLTYEGTEQALCA